MKHLVKLKRYTITNKLSRRLPGTLMDHSGENVLKTVGLHVMLGTILESLLEKIPVGEHGK